MKKFRLYLNPPHKQSVQDRRWEHLFKNIDREFQEVRTLVAGLDFYQPEAKHPLPYATLDGKKKSFENLYKTIMVDSGLTDDDYIPKEE